MWHHVMVLRVIMSMFWQSGSSPMVMICCCLRYKDPHLVMGTQHLTGDCHLVILSPCHHGYVQNIPAAGHTPGCRLRGRYVFTYAFGYLD